MLDWGIELSFTILLHEANNPGYFLNLWNVVDLNVSPTSPRCFLKLHVAWIGLTLLVTSGVNTQFPAREKICLSSKCIYEEYTVVILSNGQNWSEGNKNQNTQWWWWWDSDRDLAKKNQKLKIKNQNTQWWWWWWDSDRDFLAKDGEQLALEDLTLSASCSTTWQNSHPYHFYYYHIFFNKKKTSGQVGCLTFLPQL